MGQPKIVTTPQQFRLAGYTVLGGGKTFHYNLPPYFDDKLDGTWSSEKAFYYPFNEWLGSFDMSHCAVNASGNPSSLPQWSGGPNMCVVDGSEEQLYDYRLLQHTLGTLTAVTAEPAPWYVMAGFRRPHRDFGERRGRGVLRAQRLIHRRGAQEVLGPVPAGLDLRDGEASDALPEPAAHRLSRRRLYAAQRHHLPRHSGRAVAARGAASGPQGVRRGRDAD